MSLLLICLEYSSFHCHECDNNRAKSLLAVKNNFFVVFIFSHHLVKVVIDQFFLDSTFQEDVKNFAVNFHCFNVPIHF